MVPDDAAMFKTWHDGEARLATARANLAKQRGLAVDATFADGGARGEKLGKLIANLRGAGLDLKLQEAANLRAFPGLDRAYRRHWAAVETAARKAESERIAVLDATSDALQHNQVQRHGMKASDVIRIRAAAEAADAQRLATEGCPGRNDIAARLADLRKAVEAAF
jgi:predicted NUDIX family NTP pyrophosphohydrolase